MIDDEDDTRDMLAAVMSHAGYSVVTASNGSDALELLRTVRPELILLDIQMPQMDGAHFREAQRTSRDLISIPTVVMTGSLEESVLDVGVADTLRKPFKAQELLAIVMRNCTRDLGSER